MKIAHFIGGIDPNWGGPTTMLLQLAGEQSRRGNQVDIVCYEDAAASPQLAQTLHALGVQQGQVISAGTPRSWLSLAAAARARRVSQLIDDADILHLHGMWEGLLAAAAWLARGKTTPYVVCPAGMCGQVGFSSGRLKKWAALTLWQNRVMAAAAAIHAAALPEASDIRALGCQSPVAIIPNGVDLTPFASPPPPDTVDKWWPASQTRKRLLFLGRLHPVKGLGNLLSAWGQLYQQFPQWQLVIAGPDAHGHRRELEQQLRDSGASAATTFTGPVHGERKYALLAASQLLVLPSISESFGMAAVEAMACGLPVITTVAAPWRRIRDQGCGWWIDVGTAPLRRGLEQALALSDEQRDAMGQRGRLLAQRFSLPKQTTQVQALYDWICRRAAQPDFVYKKDLPLAEPP